MKRASSVKQKYQAAMSTQSSLVTSIETDPAWAWANNDNFNNRLETTSNLVSEQISSKFNSFFIMHGLVETKKHFANGLVVAMERFVSDVEPPVDALIKEHAKLQKMHLASVE
jgi:hypothetical protein